MMAASSGIGVATRPYSPRAFRGKVRSAAMTPDELKAEIAAGDIDTVLLALTDMQGRLQGKRLTAPWFLQSVAGHGAEGCNYLLAVDVEMNTVDGYAMSSWERGYGDFVMKPDFDTLCRTTWLDGTALCLADVEWEDGSPVVASPRQVLRAQLARLAERGWAAHAGTELEFMIFDDSYEQAWDNAYRGLTPGQPLQRRLLDARHGARGAAAAPHPQRDDGRGDGRRGLQGRVQLRPARDQLPLRRGTAGGRPARDLQERRQGDGRPGRQGDHLHGQVQRARGQLVPPAPVTARHRWLDRVRRGGGPVRPLPRRHAGGPARDDALPRPQHQLLQALRGALVRAHDGGVGSRQPHVRAARRRARRRPADRMPRPGGRCQPVPRDQRPDRRRPARRRRGARARAGAGGQRLRGRPSARRSRARCATPATCSRRARSRATRSARRSSTTTSTTRASSSRPTTRRSPIGSASGASSVCRRRVVRAAQILQQGAQARGDRVHLLARPADRFLEARLLRFPHTGQRSYPPLVGATRDPPAIRTAGRNGL